MDTITGYAPSVAAVAEADEFRKLVADEAKGKAEVTAAAALRSPEVVRRWRGALAELVDDINAQSTLRLAEWNDYRTDTRPRDEFNERRREFNAWRAGAMRYRESLLARLREANALITEHGMAVHAAGREASESKSTRLQRIEAKLDAIIKHFGLSDEVARFLAAADEAHVAELLTAAATLAAAAWWLAPVVAQ